MKELPKGERPRERLLGRGPRGLSDAELVAIILGTGHADSAETALDLSRRILKTLARGDGNCNPLVRLAEASPEELYRFRGVGPAKIAALVAAFEMGRRIGSGGVIRPEISGPEDVASLLAAEMECLDREHLRVVLLDTKNRVAAVETVTVGGLDSSTVHPREVFKAAIRRSAAAIILAHNHPSGDSTPSPQDVRATRRMIRAGKILGIEVLDHIIIGSGCYCSMRGRGMHWDVEDGCDQPVLEGE